ncbi:MAG: hypothetical protein RL722_2786 [Pseudomonadota bacterium]|jgi:integral membrane sensor domain MASE1
MSQIHPQARTTPRTRAEIKATWRELLRGTWLSVIAPSLSLLLVIMGESLRMPTWLVSVAIVLVWFAGFFILVRTQFARHHRNADVFWAFLRSLVAGFGLLALIVLFMYFNGQSGR